MKLIEISLIYETLLESKVEIIKSLLSNRLKTSDLKIFNLIEVTLNEAENSRGNYTLIGRVVLEYPKDMIKDEMESYASEVTEEIKHLISTLLSSENELFASRSSMVKLI